MNSDKTLSLALQTAYNACIRFIGIIPRIPTANVTSYLSHCRLHLGWPSIASRDHLKLASLSYFVLTKKHSSYLSVHLQHTAMPLHDRRPTRTPPQDFEYTVRITAVLENYFTISAKRLLNSLAITEFDVDRLKESKTWCF